MSELIETRLERREVFNGKLLHVFSDTVRLPDGRTSVREVLEHQGAVCVVPLKRDGTVVLVRQFRYAVGRDILEIPAGKVDPGESFYDAAERELGEEAFVVITGGVSDVISRHVSRKVLHNPHLQLQGLLLLYKKNVK